MNETMIHIVFPTVLGLFMIFWIYCLWFANKYDKNSNQLIFLFFLNLYYTPFYYFRMRRLKKEIELEKLSEEIYDQGFLDNTKKGIIDSLELWASKDNQIKAQSADKELNLTKEMFQMWQDFYQIDKAILDEVFKSSELRKLEIFNKTLNISKNKITNDNPILIEFQKTRDWEILNKLAIDISKEIK